MSEGERRRALGQRIGSAYASTAGVNAVIVGGSVSRGHADRWSDVELGVFWSEIPPASFRASLAASARLRNWRAFEGTTSIGAIEEDADADSITVDLVHMDAVTVERVLHDVMKRADPALDKQVLIAALRDGIPVHGKGLLNRWRALTDSYPEDVRLAMVTSNLVFGPHTWLEMLADRQDLLALHEVLCRIERAILGILLGVNAVYAPSAGPKWTRKLIERLAIALQDLARRMDRILTADAIDAVQNAGHLIDETLTLVERHLPDVDTERVRSRIVRHPRPLHEGS